MSTDSIHLATTRSKHARKYLSQYVASFDGILLSGIGPILRSDLDHKYVRCPCGGNDHLASMTHDSFVLHCYEHGRQWLIPDNVQRISGIIRREEEMYYSLLSRAPRIIQRWFERHPKGGESWNECLEDLYQTHGIDATNVSDVMGGLTHDHRATG